MIISTAQTAFPSIYEPMDFRHSSRLIQPPNAYLIEFTDGLKMPSSKPNEYRACRSRNREGNFPFNTERCVKRNGVAR